MSEDIRNLTTLMEWITQTTTLTSAQKKFLSDNTLMALNKVVATLAFDRKELSLEQVNNLRKLMGIDPIEE